MRLRYVSGKRRLLPAAGSVLEGLVLESTEPAAVTQTLVAMTHQGLLTIAALRRGCLPWWR